MVRMSWKLINLEAAKSISLLMSVRLRLWGAMKNARARERGEKRAMADRVLAWGLYRNK